MDVLHLVTKLFLGDSTCSIAASLALQRTGRPSYIQAAARKGQEAYCQAYFCVDRNGGAGFSSTLLRSSHKHFFSCSDCREGQEHVLYITCDTAERRLRGSGLPCLICNPVRRRSKLENHVHEVLHTHFPFLEYIPECRILEEFSGAIDFTILSERILIQVDGPVHYDCVGFSKAIVANQDSIDTRCNMAAAAQGWHMIRIHARDLASSKVLIKEVLDLSLVCKEAAKGQDIWRFSSITWSATFGWTRARFATRIVGNRIITL